MIYRLYNADDSFNSLNCAETHTVVNYSVRQKYGLEDIKMQTSNVWLFSVALFTFPILSTSHWW